ncbi:MAG TPA: hypothetical protein VGH54_28270 [Mycobacterium sp.]
MLSQLSRFIAYVQRNPEVELETEKIAQATGLTKKQIYMCANQAASNPDNRISRTRPGHWIYISPPVTNPDPDTDRNGETEINATAQDEESTEMSAAGEQGHEHGPEPTISFGVGEVIHVGSDRQGNPIVRTTDGSLYRMTLV